MRRGMTAFALVAATALAAAGCASDEQTVETGSPAEQKNEQQDELTPFEKRSERILTDWPDQVDPVKKRDNQMLPLEGAILPDADSKKFKVTVGHGSCDEDFGAHLQETGKVIIVSGWAKEDKAADMCTQQVVTDEVEVNLKEPFGDRTVIDAATGKPLENTKETKDSEDSEDSEAPR